jgi:hypothetical protein
MKLLVGGSMFKDKFPDTFEELNWKCPALLVDYVRLFAPVPVSGPVGPACPNVATENADKIREGICVDLMDSLTAGTSAKVKGLMLQLFGILFIVAYCYIMCL